MAEYIEREALKQSIKNSDMWNREKMSALMIVSAEPVADVTPVVHGRWQDYHFVKTDCPRDGFPTVKCSNCEIAFCDLINNHHFMYRYCPNCGARMIEEDK